MTAAGDLVLVDGEVHTLTEPDTTHEALAVRDGAIVRVGRTDEIEHLVGVETDVIDCEGRVVLPGFIDAHTHLESLGRYLVHADCSAATTLDEAIEALREQAATDHEWILGFGYDESEWPTSRYPTREDLDRVSTDRPVVAMRVDMHTASLNSVAFERLADDLPDADVRTEAGEPTGVVVESATEVVWEAIDPGYAETRELVTAAIDHATSLGVTCVHEKVRHSQAPRIYRDLELAGALDCRVRIDYWSDHLESVIDAGLVTNSGSAMVTVGGIKSFTDGSLGARTAKLAEAYADATGSDGDGEPSGAYGNGDESSTADDDVDQSETDHENRGQWVVTPDELREIARRASEHDLQLTVHAIGDEAIDETLTVLEGVPNVATARHRIEHVELATDDHLKRMAEHGIVASMQPNFHQWAGEGSLYDERLGERWRETNRLRDVLDAGVPLAFGSDCMPLDPLLGVHHAVTAPTASQRLSVTEALQAYTAGAAYAGFDEDRLGTIEVGTRADLVVLERSPWEHPDEIDEIEVSKTLVDGRVVYDGR